MDSTYANNLHARLDNILTDVYFGASEKASAMRTVNPAPATFSQGGKNSLPSSSGMDFVSGITYLIIGIMIGVGITYFCLDDSPEESEK